MKPYQLVNKDIWNEAINVKVLPIDQYGIASIKAWFIESYQVLLITMPSWLERITKSFTPSFFFHHPSPENRWVFLIFVKLTLETYQ